MPIIYKQLAANSCNIYDQIIADIVGAGQGWTEISSNKNYQHHLHYSGCANMTDGVFPYTATTGQPDGYVLKSQPIGKYNNEMYFMIKEQSFLSSTATSADNQNKGYRDNYGWSGNVYGLTVTQLNKYTPGVAGSNGVKDVCQKHSTQNMPITKFGVFNHPNFPGDAYLSASNTIEYWLDIKPHRIILTIQKKHNDPAKCFPKILYLGYPVVDDKFDCATNFPAIVFSTSDPLPYSAVNSYLYGGADINGSVLNSSVSIASDASSYCVNNKKSFAYDSYNVMQLSSAFKINLPSYSASNSGKYIMSKINLLERSGMHCGELDDLYVIHNSGVKNGDIIINDGKEYLVVNTYSATYQAYMKTNIFNISTAYVVRKS